MFEYIVIKNENKKMKIKLLLFVVGLVFFFSAKIASADYTANIIPEMNGDYSSVSGAYGVAFSNENLGTAWKAFDHILVDSLWTSSLPAWLQFEFGNDVRKVAKYKITGSSSASTMAPSAWEFQGTSNGTDWVTIDTQTGVAFADSETKEFIVATPAYYKAYKIVITEAALGSSANTVIEELEMYEVVINYSANIIPEMFGYDTPSGVVTASSEGSPAWNAFDYDPIATWISSSTEMPQWLGYQFTDGQKTITKYTISSSGDNAPRDWEFQGSNDGTEWTMVDSKNFYFTGNFQHKEFVASNPGSYSYYRLYVTATSNSGVALILDNIEMYTTLTAAVAPTVSTSVASEMWEFNVATLNADITGTGGEDPTRYIQWGTGPGDYNMGICDLGVGSVGVYSCGIASLSVNTTYYFQAYATNSAGTSFGDEVSFTTAKIAPSLTTNAVSSITSTSATANVELLSTGGDNPVIGVGWGISTNNYFCEAGTGPVGLYSCEMTGLIPNTTYRVLAFATNSVGMADGNVVYFTTLPAPDATGPGAPTASIDGGTYFSAQSVTLTSPVGDDVDPIIYYTLDATEPDNTNSQKNGPIVIDGNDGETIVLKAVAYDITGNKGEVMTKSYTFDKTVTTINPTNEKMIADALAGYVSISGDPANTPEVTVNVDYTLQTGDVSVFFPIGAIITRTGGGNLDFTQMKTQDITLSLNNQLTNDALGAIKIGVPDTRLTFSVPVTVVIPVGSQHDGQVLNVYYQFDGATAWNLENTCVVSSGLCTFQTTHATSFAAGTSAPAIAPAANTVNVVVNTKDKHGKNWKIYRQYKRTHNVAVQKSSYFQVRKLKKTNAAEFERLKIAYANYRGFGKKELANLSKKTQADYALYKKYRTYKMYLFYKDKAGE